MQAWSDFTSLTAGLICRSHCGSHPCSANLSSLQRPLKFSVNVHSANLRELDSPPSAIRNTRPFVSIRVGDGAQQTQQGDWSEEHGEWHFEMGVTVEASVKDDIEILVSSCTCFELYVATIPILTDRANLGLLSFPVASVMRQLQMEDRDADGMIYATPARSFDIIHGRHLHGSLKVSFETRSAPSRCTTEEFSESGYDCEQAKGPSRHSPPPQPLPLHAEVDQLPLDWWMQFSTEVDPQTNQILSQSPERGPTLPLWAQPHPAPWARGTNDGHSPPTSIRQSNSGRRLPACGDSGSRTEAANPTTPRCHGTKGCSGRPLRPSLVASAY